MAILEQARFLAELKQVRGMSLSEIAESLSRSKAWVSMRLSLLAEMSEAVGEKLFSGDFPVYAYMYVVRPFMRMNGVSPQQIDQFVQALGGHKLSLREIEQLAHGFFRGPESFRCYHIAAWFPKLLRHILPLLRPPDESCLYKLFLQKK